MKNALVFEVGIDAGAFNRGVSAMVDKVSGLGKYVAGIGLAGLGAGMVAVARGAVDASAQMEAFEMRLSTLMGSSSDARERLDELYAFAKETPFELDQVVAAEVALRGFGAAAEEVMPGLIDFAATTGAELSQSAIDIGKAWSQGATGLESDTAKILRKQVELRLGTDATKVSLDEFREAMLDTLDSGMFAGGAARLSKTFTGMVSNLKDAWSGFLRDVGTTSQLFAGIKSVLGEVLALLEESSVQVSTMASYVGDYLWEGFKFTAMAAAGLSDAIRNAYGFAQYLGGAIDLVSANIAEANSAAAELGQTILRAAGQDELAGQWGSMIGQLDQMAEASRERAAAEMEAARAIREDAFPASAAMAAMLERADRAAAGVGDSLTRPRSSAAIAATGGKKSKEEEAAGDALTAWIDFYMQLDQLRQTESDRADLWRAQELGKLESFQRQGIADAEDAAYARSKIDEEYYQRLRDISTEYEAERARQVDAAAEHERAMRAQTSEQVIGIIGNTLGTIGSMLDQSNEEAKTAYQILASAQAVIAGAVAVVRGFADLGPVGGAINAVAMGVLTAGEIATIWSAHQGYAGPVSSARPDAPDEVTTRKLKTEAVLSSQTTRALGPEGIAALERGQGVGGMGSVDLRIGRVSQREMIRGDLRTSGPLAQRLRRASRSSDMAPGMSGLRAA